MDADQLIEDVRAEIDELFDEVKAGDLDADDVLQATIDILAAFVAALIPGQMDDLFIKSLGEQLKGILQDKLERDADDLLRAADRKVEKAQRIRAKVEENRGEWQAGRIDRRLAAAERLEQRAAELDERAAELQAQAVDGE